jgi:CDK5 regulatory subunit-associated protein 3
MSDIVDLDLDYTKLLDWLQDRRRITRSWHSSLKAARVLLRSAAGTIPPSCALAATPPSSYYPLVAVLDVIADKSCPPPFPGARDVDYLNRYSHPATRAWAAARSSYESDSAYLAEAAQTLVRNADVEAPALRAEMTIQRESIAEIARKEGPTIRAAAEAKARFVSACEHFGMSDAVQGAGIDFEQALRGAVARRAPVLLRLAIDVAKQPALADALEYYCNFVSYACGSPVSNDTDEENRLCHTLFEVVYGDRDALVAPGLKGFVSDAADAPSGEVDWGSSIVPTSTDAGESIAREVGARSDRDVVGSGVIADMEALDINIEQDIDLVTDEIGASGIDWEISIPATEVDVTVSGNVDNSVKSLITLADSAIRESYKNDLRELRAFLTQRSVELSVGAGTQVSLVLQQSRGVPDTVRTVDLGRVEKMIMAVNCALDSVLGSDVSRVLSLQASGDAVSRAARDLTDKLQACARMETSIVALASRKITARDEFGTLGRKFNALAAESRELIRLTEEKLEKIYKGKRVHILGEINIIFAAPEAQ